jgi:hypothetical protein
LHLISVACFYCLFNPILSNTKGPTPVDAFLRIGIFSANVGRYDSALNNQFWVHDFPLRAGGGFGGGGGGGGGGSAGAASGSNFRQQQQGSTAHQQDGSSSTHQQQRSAPNDFEIELIDFVEKMLAVTKRDGTGHGHSAGSGRGGSARDGGGVRGGGGAARSGGGGSDASFATSAGRGDGRSTVERWVEVRCAFFDKRFTLEDAIGSHAFAPLEGLACV